MQTVGWSAPAKEEIITGAYLCCECGLCGTLYACPTRLSPDRYNAEIKKELAATGTENPHNRREIEVPEEREWRKVPVSMLVRRLGLEDYRSRIPLGESDSEINEVRIPLTQHIGAPSQPVVREGEQVRSGDLIGEIPEGKLGARVHASIDGRITEVNENYVVISK
jgi:Na+-translocating ferredoxin:NAD+ oxidoreductase RnfC subunit